MEDLFSFKNYCANFLRIKTKKGELLPLVFNPPQEQLYQNHLLPLKESHQPLRWIILKARQEGVSTFSEARVFNKAHLNKNMSCLIVAHDREATDTVFNITKNFYAYLPQELKPLTKHSNAKELVFMNPKREVHSSSSPPSPLQPSAFSLPSSGLNSSIRAQTAGWIDIGRSKTIHHLHCSEIGFWPDPETVIDGLFEAVPDLYGTTIILESTANGIGNWFHHFWKESLNGRSRFSPIFLPWFDHPDYQSSVPKGWEFTDEERKLQKETIGKWGLGTESLRPSLCSGQFHLTDEQLVWYRLKLLSKEAEHPGRGKQKMKQEYPANEDEAFISSSSSAFGDDIIQVLYKDTKEPKVRCYVDSKKVRLNRKLNIDEPGLDIWELPNSGYDYAIGVDVSGGVGGDASVIEVLRYPDYVQVAEWASDSISPLNLAYIVRSIAEFYNRALVAVEVNNHGILTNAELLKSYYRLYQWEYFDKLRKGITDKIGWDTNLSTKRLLIDLAVHLVYEGQVRINSKSLVQEMKTFTECGNSYRAEGTELDDRVMAWMIAVMAVDRKIARYSYDREVSKKGREDKVMSNPWDDIEYEEKVTDSWSRDLSFLPNLGIRDANAWWM